MSFKNKNVQNSLSSISKLAAQNTNANAGHIILVDPAECYTDGNNPRTEFDEHLVASMVRDFLNPNEGQHEACHVYPKDENGYLIHHGATRHYVGELAKAQDATFKLKVIVDHNLTKKSALERFWDQGSNNIKRNNMSIPDRANFIANYIEMAKEAGIQVNQKDIADNLGLKGGNTTISRLLSLRDMSPELKAVYHEGKTEDLEALVALSKIQKTNPDLFTQLVEKTDLDRATIRRAKKTGTIEPVADEVQVPATNNQSDKIAYAQNNEEGENGKYNWDSQEYTIPYVDYLFKTGRVHIIIRKTPEGYLGALETVFEHGINEEGSFDSSPLWPTENEAVNYVKEQLKAWAELVHAEKASLNTAEAQDISGYLSFLNSAKATPAVKEKSKQPKKKAPDTLRATIKGEVNGEECVLLTTVANEVIGSTSTSTGGFVYVQVGDTVKIADIADFVMKSISYSS